MLSKSIDTKKKMISLRIADSQMNIMETAKAGNPRIGNTDLIMAALNLLALLQAEERNKDHAYEELLNALIIHDDLVRCIQKPENPQIDNEKNMKELMLSLNENENKIITFLRILCQE